MLRRISMSTPAVGSSRIRSRGSCTSARAIMSRRFMPPESERAIGVALVPELELLQVFLRALDGEPAGNAVEARLVHDDREHLLELVEVDFLRHQADAGLGPVERAVDVVAEHRDRPAGLPDQRHDDADGRRLARAVRAEQREEVAFGDVEVDAAQRLHAVGVGLGQPANGERLHEARIISCDVPPVAPLQGLAAGAFGALDLQPELPQQVDRARVGPRGAAFELQPEPRARTEARRQRGRDRAARGARRRRPASPRSPRWSRATRRTRAARPTRASARDARRP